MRPRADREAFIERGRAAAAELYEDEVRVHRPTGETTTDGRGGVTDILEVVWEGRAKAQNDASYPSSPDVAGIARATSRVAQVHFPYGTTAVQSGDVVEFVASKNPRLVGARMRLRADEDKTWTTAVRMNVQEVLRAGQR